MATIPTIDISFKQLATTLIQRSERGTAILLLYEPDATYDTMTKVYKSVDEIDKSIYSEENLNYIKKCMAYAPYELVVISSEGEDFLPNYAPEILKVRSTGWIAYANPDINAQEELAAWIKSQENSGGTYKAIGTVSNQDCKHYVYFDQTGYDNDGNEVSKAEYYLPSLLGIIASCNVTKGCTNFLCSDLSSVNEVEGIDEAVAAGQLVLTNDIGGVRIVTGCNSLTSLDGNTSTEDMQYIETVETMDLIRDDIRTVFKTTYQGKFRNKYKYQMLFIGAVNQYYSQLENEDILDDEFDNKAEIDATEQRSAWLGTGKSEAEDWDDDKVKRMAFKRSVFIASNIKVLGSMENLKFTVTLE